MSLQLSPCPSRAIGILLILAPLLGMAADNVPPVPPHPFNASVPAANWYYTLLDTTPPSISSVFPQPGAILHNLGQIEVTFTEDVEGVNAADLLINGQPATNVLIQPGARYTFQFAAVSTGAVSVTWAGDHAISDLATPANPFQASPWAYQVQPGLSYGNIRINEILAANATGITDAAAIPEDPDPLPWIELHNAGSTAVNLAGWSLSDDPEFPGQWVFPAMTLPPGGFLIVFTSGLDLRNPTGTNRLHTNFKLGRGGEFLGLYSPDSPRQLVSGFAPGYPEQRNDRSYGYDSSDNLRYFSPPTPGAANGTSTVSGVVEPVHFSASRGHYTQPFQLTLTTPTPGAIIRYTTDGREPTDSVGQTYVLPLRLTGTTLLRAAAFRTNLLPSRIGTHSYLFNVAPGIRSLPVISIVTDADNLTGPNGIIGISNVTQQSDGTYRPNTNAGGEVIGYHNPSQHGLAWERPTSVELIRPGDNSGFQVDAGIRVQGSDYQRPRTRPDSKFSYRLYFRSDYGSGRLNYPMFPLTTVDGFDQMVLRAGFNENSNPFIRDEITRRLSHDMGEVAAHGTMAVLFVNGQFFNGSPFYNPTERVHEEMLQAHLGGGGEWDVVGPDFGQTAGAPGVIDGDRADFANLMTNFWGSSGLRPITSDTAYVRVSRRLDLQNFADYCLLNAYVAMGDWPANNWRAGRERSPNGIWRYIGWDCEWAMGIYSLGVTRDSFGFSGTGTEDAGLNSTVNSEIARTYQALYANREFRLLMADRVQKHFFQGGALTGLNISNRFDQLRRDLIGVIPSMDTEILAWARDRLPIIMTQFNTYGLYGYSNALHGVYASSNAPVFSQHGGRVPPGFSLTLTAPIPGSAIYYTINGADPRVMFSGAVSNDARLYEGPVPLSQTVLVRTRALLNGTHWSALNEATFDVARIGVPLRISELHYNPSDSQASEFIELQNLGGAPVDLSEMYFDGVNFTFNTGTSLDAGARLVLATSVNPTAFAARYPGVNVFGYYGGSLNNGGERITLFDRDANIITSVDYRDDGAWPAAADGGGRSLEIADVNGDPDDPANWHASSSNGGSPGTINSAVILPEILLSEVMPENGGSVSHDGTFPDWIELQNSSLSPINLGGWSLTDDSDRRKFVFPAGTTIAAQDFLVVWCDSATNATPGLHAGFALDRSGETIALFDPSTNRVDAVSFGPQLIDLSISRFGPVWQLSEPTPGAMNRATDLASPAALVINEWQANAPAGQADWIELYNSAALPVALQGIHLSNGGAVHRVASPSFVAAGGYVQLVADEQPGPNHLDFKLSAAGGAIVLYDPAAAVLDGINYTNTSEGVTRGRYPDGSTSIIDFPDSPSPGASNYMNTYSGPVINEVFARNQTVALNNGRIADYVELFNPSASPFSLNGMSMSVDRPEPGQFAFPINTSVPANGYLVIWCDATLPVSHATGDLNAGRSLDGEGGGAWLFNTQGQMVSAVEYGFQVRDLPIGLNDGQWRLLSVATPGAGNAGAATLGSDRVLRINEWMANPSGEDDWFELYNSTNVPVELSGLALTDDPTTLGFGQFHVAPLSYVGPRGFVKWIANGNAGKGANHVNFSLNDAGEFIGLYANPVPTNFVLIDAVAFEAQQRGVSEGRLPDGTADIVRLTGSPTPAASNYRRHPGIIFTEILPRAGNPSDNAVELFNLSPQPIVIGGWYLSNDQDDVRKFRIPDASAIPPGGFTVFSQAAFGAGSPIAFTLDGTHGGEIWLSEADASGNLTGRRVGASFGPSASAVSFVRVETSAGPDFAPALAPTLGASNALPLVGPVLINEIMYHPADTATISGDDEFIELRNPSGTTVLLHDSAVPANPWRITGGVEYSFPANAELAAGSYALVVPFDPANVVLLGAFRAKYAVAPTTPVFGPYSGRLDNGGDRIRLTRPDATVAGYLPQITVDTVDYTDHAPWPGEGVDGGGLSLQRLTGLRYGNEPTHWVAATPTPGTVNSGGIVAPPTIVSPPEQRSVLEGNPVSVAVTADGPGPLAYQWRFNAIALPQATNSSFSIEYPLLENDGLYDCIVSNPGGSAVSAAARLVVLAPPTVLVPPVSQVIRTGSNVVFSVFARGTPPLGYQWRFNGSTLTGETNESLSLSGINISNDGDYGVVISNPVSAALADARLVVLSNTVITVPPPLNLTVVTSSFFTVSIAAAGNPLPFGFEWRRGSFPVASNEVNSRTSFVTLQAPPNLTRQSYRVVVRNLANPGLTANFQFFVTTLVDTDVDGVPDNWENSFGLDSSNSADAEADTDGDGLTNYQEYLAGTDPTDAFSRLEANISVAGRHALVRFEARSDISYSVEYNDAPGAGLAGWQTLGSILAGSGNRTEVLTDAAPATNRFYRIVTPGHP